MPICYTHRDLAGEVMNERVIVGQYIAKFNTLLGLYLPEEEIYQYPGLVKHVAKKHQSCLEYISHIPDIIKNPDYIGKHPDIPFSVEFIKRFDKNILVAVQLDEAETHFYVSNLYDVTFGKINQKLFSGRLVEYP